jgi:hypothetical protein
MIGHPLAEVSENHCKNLEEEQQAEVCMGISVVLKNARDDENRADKGSVGQKLIFNFIYCAGSVLRDCCGLGL